MKKIKFTLLALASMATTLCIMSCNKDDISTPEFSATMEQCTDLDSKTTLQDNYMHWVSGDQIKVIGTIGSGIYAANNTSSSSTTFSLVSGDPGEAPYRAFYPASAVTSDGYIELPVVQATVDGSLTCYPMYAESNNSTLDFKHVFGILRMRLQKSNVSINAIEIIGNTEIAGDYNVTLNENVPTVRYVGNGTQSILMTCSTAQNINSQKDFYIYLPAGDLSGLVFKIYSSDGGVCTKTVRSDRSVSIQRGCITTITLSNNNLTFTPNAGMLNGLFTINESGDQVRFAQGNLQYTTLGSHAVNTGGTQSGTWHFAPHQYDYVGASNLLAAADYTKWIDLFRWIASGWNSGHASYMPYSYGLDNDDFNYGYEGDLTGDHANGDCGVFNAISNGGNTPNVWRTMTESEARYLIDTRSASTVNGVENARWFRATIGGTAGIVLLPDVYTHPVSVALPSGINDIEPEYNINTYSLSEWELMETAGAVFLPFGGSIDGWYPTATYDGEALSTHELSYITASSHGTISSIRATTIKFHAREAEWDDWQYEYYGGTIGWSGKMRRQNIRLVRDAN